MKKQLLYLCIPLLLTGCIGSLIFNQTEYLNENFPDIRNVPERTEAIASRGIHQEEETASRAIDLKELKQDWEKITARDKALREQLFPPPAEQDQIP
jgi:hypothetical protein